MRGVEQGDDSTRGWGVDLGETYVLLREQWFGKAHAPKPNKQEDPVTKPTIKTPHRDRDQDEHTQYQAQDRQQEEKYGR